MAATSATAVADPVVVGARFSIPDRARRRSFFLVLGMSTRDCGREERMHSPAPGLSRGRLELSGRGGGDLRAGDVVHGGDHAGGDAELLVDLWGMVGP